MKNYQITVMTPTYNRAYLLPRLYKSLKNQTFKDFEWIIVDDGSTDHTMNLVSDWIMEEKDFKIIFVKVKNGGKHRAINQAIDIARGELFFIVDSDDQLTTTALEKISSWEKTLNENEKKTFAGVSGNVGYSEETLVGTTFTGDYLDATSLEREKYQINGDKAEVFYTQLLRKYKFPEIDGENFITEFVVWFHIAHDGYKIRWFNDIIYICEYLEDGLTKNSQAIAAKNPKGYQLANELYQKFYGGYLQKEKEEAIGHLQQLVLVGNLQPAVQLFSKLPELLNKDIELQLLLIQIYFYQQDFKKARKCLESLELVCLKNVDYYLKLANLGHLINDKTLEVNARQKALFYSQDKTVRTELLRQLQEEHGLTNSQIFDCNYKKIKQLYEENKLQDCFNIILADSGFDESLQLELLALSDHPFLKEYLIRLIIGSVEGFTVDQNDLPYVYGHVYYEAGRYIESLQNFQQISQHTLTPLTAYRLSKLYKIANLKDKAATYWELYLKLKKQLK